MAIEVGWVNIERNMILWQFTGQWTIDEFRLATQKTQGMVEEIDHKFDLIFDALSAKTPRFPMTEFQRALKIPILKRDQLIVVTNDMFITSVLSILRRLGLPNMSRDRLSIASTLEEAYERVASRRETYLIEQ